MSSFAFHDVQTALMGAPQLSEEQRAIFRDIVERSDAKVSGAALAESALKERAAVFSNLSKTALSKVAVAFARDEAPRIRTDLETSRARTREQIKYAIALVLCERYGFHVVTTVEHTTNVSTSSVASFERSSVRCSAVASVLRRAGFDDAADALLDPTSFLAVGSYHPMRDLTEKLTWVAGDYEAFRAANVARVRAPMPARAGAMPLDENVDAVLCYICTEVLSFAWVGEQLLQNNDTALIRNPGGVDLEDVVRLADRLGLPTVAQRLARDAFSWKKHGEHPTLYTWINWFSCCEEDRVDYGAFAAGRPLSLGDRVRVCAETCGVPEPHYVAWRAASAYAYDRGVDTERLIRAWLGRDVPRPRCMVWRSARVVDRAAELATSIDACPAFLMSIPNMAARMNRLREIREEVATLAGVDAHTEAGVGLDEADADGARHTIRRQLDTAACDIAPVWDFLYNTWNFRTAFAYTTISTMTTPGERWTAEDRPIKNALRCLMAVYGNRCDAALQRFADVMGAFASLRRMMTAERIEAVVNDVPPFGKAFCDSFMGDDGMAPHDADGTPQKAVCVAIDNIHAFRGGPRSRAILEYAQHVCTRRAHRAMESGESLDASHKDLPAFDLGAILLLAETA